LHDDDAKARPDELKETARRIRAHSLMAIHAARSGHPGGALSAADLLAWVWLRELDGYAGGDPENAPARFVLSKGHACPALYAAAAEAGLLPRRELLGLRKLGHPLQGHTDVTKAPWVETSTGSLGQGFSVAIGMALGLRYRNRAQRVYVMLGDGELQEGEVWEGAMFAAHHRLDNLCAILDYNKMQSDDRNENVIGLEPLRAKWESFGWHAVEIDGHEFGQIEAALDACRGGTGRPSIVIAHTLKGKGVSFMEDEPPWHGSLELRDDELTRALRDLDVPEETIARYFDGTLWR
jgi:transketolase